MTVELLNTLFVKEQIDGQGLKRSWVVEQLGWSQAGKSAGYRMLRMGELPQDPDRKREVLRKLSKLLGVPAKDLVVTLQARSA